MKVAGLCTIDSKGNTITPSLARIFFVTFTKQKASVLQLKSARPNPGFKVKHLPLTRYLREQ